MFYYQGRIEMLGTYDEVKHTTLSMITTFLDENITQESDDGTELLSIDNHCDHNNVLPTNSLATSKRKHSSKLENVNKVIIVFYFQKDLYLSIV